MGTYQQDEFLRGCKALGCDSIQKWQAALPKLRAELKTDAVFARVYKFAYSFAANATGFRTVDVEMCCDLWDLLFGAQCKFLGKWKDFLTKEKKELNAVPQDTWNLFINLVTSTKGDLKNFEDDGAWPSLVDEFIMYAS